MMKRILLAGAALSLTATAHCGSSTKATSPARPRELLVEVPFSKEEVTEMQEALNKSGKAVRPANKPWAMRIKIKLCEPFQTWSELDVASSRVRELFTGVAQNRTKGRIARFFQPEYDFEPNLDSPEFKQRYPALGFLKHSSGELSWTQVLARALRKEKVRRLAMKKGIFPNYVKIKAEGLPREEMEKHYATMKEENDLENLTARKMLLRMSCSTAWQSKIGEQTLPLDEKTHMEYFVRPAKELFQRLKDVETNAGKVVAAKDLSRSHPRRLSPEANKARADYKEELDKEVREAVAALDQRRFDKEQKDLGDEVEEAVNFAQEFLKDDDAENFGEHAAMEAVVLDLF